METDSGETYYFHIPLGGPSTPLGTFFKATGTLNQLRQLYKAFKGFGAETTETLDGLEWEDMIPPP